MPNNKDTECTNNWESKIFPKIMILSTNWAFPTSKKKEWWICYFWGFSKFNYDDGLIMSEFEWGGQKMTRQCALLWYLSIFLRCISSGQTIVHFWIEWFITFEIFVNNTPITVPPRPIKSDRLVKVRFPAFKLFVKLLKYILYISKWLQREILETSNKFKTSKPVISFLSI